MATVITQCMGSRWWLAAITITLMLTSFIGINGLSEGHAKLEPAEGRPSPPSEIGHPSLLSPHASPVAVHGEHVFVVNTPSDTVDVIARSSRQIIKRIDVGVDPVSLAVRPDGKEVWVANHVSDSVSVIDSHPDSPTYLSVVATLQQFDNETRATRFDEPVGIAFANDEKAYVALSSENEIAVIDVKRRQVSKRLPISAQDPRAITVRHGRLYVIPFESNNKTQLSGGSRDDIDGELVTFDAWDHSIANNNVLSLGHVTDIVKHPEVPDHDLYVFDTETDKLVETVDTLGTLLYGLAVDSAGRVFIAQTDARNDINGRSGTQKHALKELENRAFLNQITTVTLNGDNASGTQFIDLEPLPPHHPEPGQALATPFGIAVNQDNTTLFVTAAGSNKLFSVHAASGKVLGRVSVDAVPRGIALEPDDTRAWVFNAVANTVSLVDVSEPTRLEVLDTVVMEDPTHPTFKRGRIAFNNARASSTETFSCASCHPDGHTDQLLWVLKTPIVTGGDQIMPRSTMPVRGLRDTAPFHWDGIPGDPYGGINSESTRRAVEPNSSEKVPTSTTRHLIDGALSSTMALVDDSTVNDEKKAGRLSSAERDDMSEFLLHVTYPPAQRRAYTNKLSKRAEDGFKMFHIVGDVGGTPGANLCGNCHRMPFWVSTNTPGSGMDAPTWRGAYDRFLILPQGRLNIIDFDFYRRVAEAGYDERSIWQFSWGGRRAFNSVWDMVLEGSTGFSGAYARQVTVNEQTAKTVLTRDMLNALEASAEDEAIVLQVEGVFMNGEKPLSNTLQFDAHYLGGSYVEIDGARGAHSRRHLVALAKEGKFVGTFTGRHGASDDLEHPQPALWTLGSIHEQRGQQQFPILYPEMKTMTVSARHLREDVRLIIDGRRVPGTIEFRDDEQIAITLDSLPSAGMHFLQVQNPDGLFSNDFIFHVAEDEAGAQEMRYENYPDLLRDALAQAIERGDLKEAKRFLDAGAPINARRNSNGMTPLSTAAFHGHTHIVKHLVEERRARISHDNRDGNTPLHLAAFLCRMDVIDYLLENGASTTKRSHRGERAVDTVTSDWNDGLAGFYRSISSGSNMNLNLAEIERFRPLVVAKLTEFAAEPEDALEILSRSAAGWRYWDAPEAPPSDWFQTEFDDSNWNSGQAPLGYGEEDVATAMSFGENAEDKTPAAFFRRSFEVEDLSAAETYAAAVRADDGAVVYLNGKEIHRLRMPEGTIQHRTFSAGNTQSGSGLEGRLLPFRIQKKDLQEGLNVLAVSVHQRHGASSDLVLDVEILGLERADFRRLVRLRNQQE